MWKEEARERSGERGRTYIDDERSTKPRFLMN